MPGEAKINKNVKKPPVATKTAPEIIQQEKKIIVEKTVPSQPPKQIGRAHV